MDSFAYNPNDYKNLPTLSQAIDNFDSSVSQTVLDGEIW